MENTQAEETELQSGKTEASIIGAWACDELVAPQSFYGEHYDAQITKTNVQMRTTYVFKSDGTFETGVSILNIDEVEKEYKSLMVEGARKEAEAQGKYLSTDNVSYFESYAEKVLREVCATEKGTYIVDGAKIIYIVNGETTVEEFVLNDNKLTVIGTNDNTYSMTLTRQ